MTKFVTKAVYLTVKQLAERWQCSEKMVRRLIESRELIVHRFGRLVRISLSDVVTYERIHRMG